VERRVEIRKRKREITKETDTDRAKVEERRKKERK
jgi:hypothetical protein